MGSTNAPSGNAFLRQAVAPGRSPLPIKRRSCRYFVHGAAPGATAARARAASSTATNIRFGSAAGSVEAVVAALRRYTHAFCGRLPGLGALRMVRRLLLLGRT
jgi:hypothetical protein